MALNVRWSESAMSSESFNVRAETIAFYMMFCGMQSITEKNVAEFALRWNLWDVTVNGSTNVSNDERVEILKPFIGTTANVIQKTFSQFLSGDIKRIAKDHRVI
jgi:hypothetical protein